jgi:hypothetical protein
MCPACLTTLALWIAGTSAPAGIAGYWTIKTLREKQKGNETKLTSSFPKEKKPK